MKKVLVVMLVLGMASLVNASVIAVEPNGVGSMLNAGTSTDPLEIGEVLNLKIMLQNVPGSGIPGVSYEGYVLSSLDIDLHVTGPGILAEKGTALKNQMKHNSQFGAWTEPEPAVVANGIANFGGTGPVAGIQAYPNDALLVWNLIITCTGEGQVLIDLTLHGPPR